MQVLRASHPSRSIR